MSHFTAVASHQPPTMGAAHPPARPAPTNAIPNWGRQDQIQIASHASPSPRSRSDIYTGYTGAPSNRGLPAAGTRRYLDINDLPAYHELISSPPPAYNTVDPSPLCRIGRALHMSRFQQASLPEAPPPYNSVPRRMPPVYSDAVQASSSTPAPARRHGQAPGASASTALPANLFPQLDQEPRVIGHRPSRPADVRQEPAPQPAAERSRSSESNFLRTIGRGIRSFARGVGTNMLVLAPLNTRYSYWNRRAAHRAADENISNAHAEVLARNDRPSNRR